MRFIFGRAGTGKSRLCLSELQQELKRSLFGVPLILLVPEQSTHQMEMALAKSIDCGGILRGQVLSFRRLAWKVFSETGGGNKVLIGEMGKKMLLRRILLKHRLEFSTFARSATRPGMADLLTQLIGEFKTYRIEPQVLKEIHGLDEVLTNKMNDLALIYEQFNCALGDNVRDPDDELTVLGDKLILSESLKGSKLWLDGFKGFTPQELYVLENILSIAAEVTVTLPIDPEIILDEHRIQTIGFKPGQDVFSGAWKTYLALVKIARETGTIIEPPVFLNKTYRFKRPELLHLEKYYYHYPTVTFAKNDSNTCSEDHCSGDLISSNPIKIFSVVNRRSEAEHVARELRKLARDEGYRWNEIAVLTRDLPGYQSIVEQTFNSFDIPHFLDSKRPVIHHPLIELILAVIEVAKSNYSYESVFRCLKTDFFPLHKDSVDRLENYVLSHGIKGLAWKSSEDWKYQRRWTLSESETQQEADLNVQKEINKTKRIIQKILLPFTNSISSSEDGTVSVRTVTTSLYNLLESLNLSKLLKAWAIEAEQAGNLGEARLQVQIWETVINILDEMVTGLGDEYLTLEDYALVLASGLENLNLGLIPPGLDQVLVGSLDRSRNPEVRVLFVLGANDGILPARASGEGVLDSDERLRLEQLGINLSPKGKTQIHEEQFFIYTALTRATERLNISYPLTDEEGKGLTVSPVIARIMNLFPELTEQFLNEKSDSLDIISHPRPLLQVYASQLRNLRKGEPLNNLWQAAENWLLQDSTRIQQVNTLKAGAFYENKESKIPKVLARRLYGKKLLASVSRLELYAKCPFSHYARYGLRLNKRSLYELASPDLGQYFHAILRDFAETVRQQGLDWGSMPKEESWSHVSQIAEKIAPQLQNEILLSNARFRYLKNKLKRTVHHAVRVLGEHARRGVFTPIQMEISFGPDETLPGLEISLSEEESLILRGQIDRIDGTVINNQIFLRILDYKSRETSLTLDSIFYGLNLQLLTYLVVALQGAEVLLSQSTSESTNKNTAFIKSSEYPKEIKAYPAGFLYFPVVEPLLDEKIPVSVEQLDQKKLKALKVRGFLLANRQVLEAMDSNLTSGESDLLGLKINKDDSFRKGSNVLTETQFNELSSYLKYYLAKTGEEIMSGEISLSPFKRGNINGCQYCDYKPVCNFDPNLPENQYHSLKVINNEDIWDHFKVAEHRSLPIEASTQSSELMDGKVSASEMNWLGEERGEGEIDD
ncbi:MAG: helicase-exonuclease AddAB subunit AddB [Desulfitobacterium hafniense]|nr:helicase-exonuclease AddAB subunit AddB [Desulfitobacterium hafniense]